MKYALRAAAFAVGFIALPALADGPAGNVGVVMHRVSGPNCAVIQVTIEQSDVIPAGQTVWFQLVGGATQQTPGKNKDEVLEDFIASVPGSQIQFVISGAPSQTPPCTPYGAVVVYSAAAVMQ